MADASEGTLTRTSVDAATAAMLMASREPASAATAAYGGALPSCKGTCEKNVCVLTPQEQ
jgi:hypothetical protein